MTTPSLIVIERITDRLIRKEEEMMRQYAREHAIPIELLTLKQLRRQSSGLLFSPNNLFVGSIAFFLAAIKRMGVAEPTVDCYPSGLTSFMHRKVFTAQLRDALYLVNEGEPLFIKPAIKWKSFTGRVFRSSSELFSSTSARQMVYVSEIVQLDVISLMAKFG